MDRRQRSLQQQKRIESMAAMPSTNIAKTMGPTIKPSMPATPSTNVIKAKGPVSSTRKMPNEE